MYHFYNPTAGSEAGVMFQHLFSSPRGRMCACLLYTSGLANANALLTRIKTGEADYQFVEIMACPGGCVNGGGQPQQPGYIRNTVDIRGLRAKVLYDSCLLYTSSLSSPHPDRLRRAALNTVNTALTQGFIQPDRMIKFVHNNRLIRQPNGCSPESLSRL